jgi:hypothetical protein
MTRKFFQLFVAGFAYGAVLVVAFAGARASEPVQGRAAMILPR